MNALRRDIRDQASAMALQIAKEWGEEIAYSHEGADPVTLYVVPHESNLSYSSSDDVDSDVTKQSFDIPRQCNFPPASEVITSNDDITYLGQKWVIDTVKANSVGSNYIVDCTRNRATNINGA